MYIIYLITSSYQNIDLKLILFMKQLSAVLASGLIVLYTQTFGHINTKLIDCEIFVLLCILCYVMKYALLLNFINSHV